MNLATTVSLHCVCCQDTPGEKTTGHENNPHMHKMKAADLGDHRIASPGTDRPSTPVGRIDNPRMVDPGRLRADDGGGGTKSVGGEQVPMSKFAYVGDPKKKETWKFPVHNKRHAQLAIQMWHQGSIPADKKAAVISRIHRAARSHGITDRIK
jgi:hypothetical protein